VTSHISLEASTVVGNEWTEAEIYVTRTGEPDQELHLTPAEMEALYRRLRLFYEQGIWSMGTVSE